MGIRAIDPGKVGNPKPLDIRNMRPKAVGTLGAR